MIIVRPDKTIIKVKNQITLNAVVQKYINKIYTAPGWYLFWKDVLFAETEVYLINKNIFAIYNIFPINRWRRYECVLNNKRYRTKEEIEKLAELALFI